MLPLTTDEHWMRQALALAERARDQHETPVGAIVVREGVVVGRGHNQVETLGDPTAHAEVLAIGAAANTLESWRLDGCTLYVTLEPCAMCAYAAILARVDRIVFGAREPRSGACGSLLHLPETAAGIHHVLVDGGHLADDVAEMMREFFRELRKTNARGSGGPATNGNGSAPA